VNVATGAQKRANLRHPKKCQNKSKNGMGKYSKVKNNQDRLFMTVTHTHLAESINFPTEIVTFEDGPTTI
jgi:hypothetical protein